ncbi:UPF0390 protein [Penicillium capsulatum]|uniref:UPF0390 protein n=1 Tax=Penicillium capsulatum TaxID=69766 RepID=A0A9W9LW99_9EURO|nr:UPF0390 protein [Penicillium capsulatum]KAJ6122695.1 UPF0390 protein [Penicillium capsulatum]
MAQGLLKKSKPTTASAKRTASANSRTKPGPRQVAPKKASLIRQQKLNKKLTSGLVAKTERSLASKAGHLEMLAGGKKDKDGKGKKK